jgi:hypothetical protein
LLLPVSNEIRETYTFQFTRLLTLKALSVCKYIETECKIPSPLDLVSSTKNQETLPKVNKEMLMKELGLGDSLMDLFVILCFTEKLRPNSYKDVLGDPQKDIEHILIDLEFV